MIQENKQIIKILLINNDRAHLLESEDAAAPFVVYLLPAVEIDLSPSLVIRVIVAVQVLVEGHGAMTDEFGLSGGEKEKQVVCGVSDTRNLPEANLSCREKGRESQRGHVNRSSGPSDFFFRVSRLKKVCHPDGLESTTLRCSRMLEMRGK